MSSENLAKSSRTAPSSTLSLSKLFTSATRLDELSLLCASSLSLEFLESFEHAANNTNSGKAIHK